MESINIRSLKNETSAILERVALGESLEIRRHNQPLAILAPLKPTQQPGKRPDFRNRLQTTYGDKVLPESATELLANERGDR